LIDPAGLDSIEGFSLPVYASPGGGARARALAARTQHTLDWLGSLVEVPAPPPLFVLDPGDWRRIALIPQYGLAHVSRTRIVMGQRRSGLWALVADSVWPSTI
jgi:hypothetical protein